MNLYQLNRKTIEAETFFSAKSLEDLQKSGKTLVSIQKTSFQILQNPKIDKKQLKIETTTPSKINSLQNSPQALKTNNPNLGYTVKYSIPFGRDYDEFKDFFKSKSTTIKQKEILLHILSVNISRTGKN